MLTSTHPAFAKLGPKLERTRKELDQLDAFLDSYKGVSPELPSDWGRMTAIASAVHNIYNGLEDVLLSLAGDVDNHVPMGQNWHQDLLDQMAVEIATKRPAILDGELFPLMAELRGFRHLVRHRYGIDLDPVRTVENLQRVRLAFPAFIEAVRRLERYMTAPEREA